MALDQTLGPFDITNADLNRLTPADAVDVFHDLLVAEAMATSRPVSAISVPKAITTADGGIDAEVQITPGALIPAGLLRNGHVRYQIKTGHFSVSTLADIKALLIRPKDQDRTSGFKPEHLSPRVKACLDMDGTFVAVLFGSDAVGTTDGYRSVGVT